MEFIPTWKDYWVLLQFIGLFGLSGWLTYRLVVRKLGELSRVHQEPGAKGDTLQNLINSILLSVISGLVPTSFFLVFCAQVGFFRIRFLLLLLAVYSFACLAYLLKSGKLSWCRPQLRWTPFGWSDLWLFGVLALGVFTFGRPSEYVTSQRDPGEYVNIAVRLAQEQGLRFTDADYEDFNTDRQQLFLPVPLDQSLHLEVIPGFSLVDPKTGEMLPQYLHLFSLWLALAFKLWRFDGLFAVNLILGLLSALILVPLSVDIFRSRTVGLLASTLLCLNLGQIWLVRSPFSEVLAQVLLLAGIWTLTLAMSHQQAGLGFLSGLMFGLTLLVRIDSLLAVLAVLFFLFLVRSSIRPPQFSTIWLFLMGLGLSLVYVVIHFMLFAYPYVSTILLNLGLLSSLNRSWGWLAMLSLLVIILIWKRKLIVESSRFGNQRAATLSEGVFNRTSCSETWRTKLFLGVSAVVTIAFAYGYFIRPLVASGNDLLPLPPPYQKTIHFYDELNLVRLGWYLSPLGLFLAYVGSILAVRRFVLSRQIYLGLFLVILGTFALFYCYKSRAFPDNYWVIRRYSEIVIPGFLILAAFSIRSLHRMVVGRLAVRVRSRVYRLFLRTCSPGLFILLVIWHMVIAWPFFREKELSSTLKQIEVLASRLVAADVVLFEYGIAQQFFLGPLRNLFRQSIFPLAHLRPDPGAFERVVSQWTAEGKKIFLLASEEHTSLKSSKYKFSMKERFQFSTRVVEQTYQRIPRSMERVHYNLQIYEVEPRAHEILMPTLSLNTHSSFGYASTGFHQTELGGGQDLYRWSKGDASVELSEIDDSQPAALIVRLARSAIGPTTKSPVKILLNGHDLGQIQLSQSFNNYKVLISASQLARGENNLVEFRSDTFNALANQASEDSRDLGFMLDCVKLQALVPLTVASFYQIDFGSECSEIRMSAFYRMKNAGYYWTGLSPSLTFPVPIENSQDYDLLLRAVKSSPDPSYRQFLTIWINEVELETKELVGTGDEFSVYSFRIPRRALNKQPPVIRMRVYPMWNPSLQGESLDYRNLGCALDWIRIEGHN